MGVLRVKGWAAAQAAICGAALCGLAAGSALVRAAGIEDADPAKGKQVYSLYCQTCHGEKGDGQGPAGKALNPPPRDFTKAEFKFGAADADLFNVISNGAAAQKGSDGTTGSPLMAPWGNVIPEQDRWALVKYIRTLKTN
jgi:mono/diheme cytochrome c family protein